MRFKCERPKSIYAKNRKCTNFGQAYLALENQKKIFFCLVNICHNNVAFDQSLRRVNNVDLLVNLGLNALFN